MADFSNLIATIVANIRTNGTEAITGSVLQSVLIDMVNDLGEHAGGAVNGFVVVDSIGDLPDPGEEGIGYLVGTHMYLYVGEGGDTDDGKYQDVGEFKGPPGETGVGFQSVTSAEDGTIVITLTSGDTITIDLNHDHLSYEEKSNKVTSLSSSSTDDEYPSAKCVYDIVGDIETLLAAL